MKNLLHYIKHFFVPNESNDHAPHALRNEAVLSLIAILVFVEVLLFAQVFLISHGDRYLGEVLPSVLTTLTNEERKQNDLPELTVDSKLEEAAKLKAEDMAKRGYFSHNTPEGQEPWIFLDKVGYKYSYAGENLAVNFADSKDVINAWEQSTAHRNNLLGNNYQDIGIASAVGFYKGKEAVFVVQFFGNEESSAANKSKTINNEKEKTKNVVIATNAGVGSEVRGAETSPIKTSNTDSREMNALVRLTSSPRASINALLEAVLTLVLVMISIAVFVKLEHQHLPLIANSAVLVGVLIFMILGNIYLFENPLELPLDVQDASVSAALKN